jgi:hypothetical protein
MASQLVQAPAQLIGFQPKADRSYKLTFETRQLTGEEVAILADSFQQEGWVLFKPNEALVEADIPTVDADAGLESPSVRLRKRLWLYWQQQGKQGSFEAFYLAFMQRQLEAIDAKLT